MRLQTETFTGELRSVVPLLNEYGARFVFGLYIEPGTRKRVTVVWKFDDYPSYLRWCEKRGVVPIPTDEFFK